MYYVATYTYMYEFDSFSLILFYILFIRFFKGWKADEAGNVVFCKTAYNFNQAMGWAATTTIVEVCNATIRATYARSIVIPIEISLFVFLVLNLFLFLLNC
jgi:hypothetical protein